MSDVASHQPAQTHQPSEPGQNAQARHNAQAGHNAGARHPARAIRASDGERDEVVVLLQRHFADGRLTQAEFDERAGAALTAQTRDQLGALTDDLPAAEARPVRQAPGPEPWLLCLLLCVCPPAGIAYWLLSGGRAPWVAAAG